MKVAPLLPKMQREYACSASHSSGLLDPRMVSEWMDEEFWRTPGELTLSFLQPAGRVVSILESGEREDYECKLELGDMKMLTKSFQVTSCDL